MSFDAFKAVRDSSSHKGAALLLMICIADRISQDTDKGHVVVGKLARDTRMTERYVQKLLGKLIASGELVIEPIPGRTSYYYIPLLPGEPGYNPQPCDDKSHDCNGMHTPLNVNRADSDRAERARRKKAQQEAQRVNPSSPPQKPHARVNPSSPPGEPEDTPPRTAVHPRVNPSSPNSYLSPSDSPHDVPLGAPSPTACEYDPDKDADVRRWRDSREGQAYLFNRKVSTEAPFTKVRYMLREWLREGGEVSA